MKKSGFFLILVLVMGCKQKKKEQPQDDTFFPVLSFIKSQVAHVDTSFYPIYKVTWKDSTHTDTNYFKREEFAIQAKDFLEIPDLSDKRYKNLYTEEKFYDAGLNKVIMTYLPKNPDSAIIQREEVLINTDQAGDDVNSFIIKISMTNKDSTVAKTLLWQVNKSFLVSSIVQKPGTKEIENRFKVIWNEDDKQ